MKLTRGCVAIVFAGIAFAGITLSAVGQLGAAGQTRSSSAPSLSIPHRDFVGRYCVSCHNERLRTGGLSLDRLDVENAGQDAATWEAVVRKLRAGQMPPVGMPRPDPASHDAFLAYLESELDRVAAARLNPGRSPALHRLNRAEYTNAVRDLLAVEIDGESLLPADDAGHGFDNVADMLSVSPRLVEGYVAAAAKITRLAVGDGSTGPVSESYDVPRRLLQDDRTSEDLPFGTRGGIAIRHHFPADGDYVVRVRLRRNKDNYILGLGEPHLIEVRLDGALIKRLSVGGEHKGRSGVIHTFINPNFRGDPEQELYEFTADEALEVRFPASAGTRLVAVAFLKETYESESERLPPQTFDELAAGGYKTGAPAVDRVTISGPIVSRRLGDTLSRQRIFVCRPNGSADDEPCARRILSTLARRAYRRPVTDDDVNTLFEFYRAGRGEGGFESGIRAAIQRILVSPHFLFRVEREPDGIAPETAYQVSDLELASRLSFFLWSSIPDEALLDVAENRTLRHPQVLNAQVERMLADPRSKALVRNFAGQWLSLRKLRQISPDPTVFPDYDDNLKEAFQQETELFFDSVLREGRGVLELLDADYTFLNERLARHYGVADIFGSHLRRVALTGDQRRGLLGHGSILTATSYVNRTAPTLRGAWILENLLGTPPPPPPPDVASLKESGDARPLGMRERMDLHKREAACASCHRLMDPLGFALENFDAIGGWRESDAGSPIDPSGTLPDGTTVDGPAALRRALTGRGDQFVHTFTEKLLTYALGRGVEFYDAPAVRQVMREAAATNYSIRSLIAGIVRSPPFQMRRSRPS